MISARIRRAERKAVSPEVMGQTMTPATASTPPTTPSTPVEISYTTFDAPPLRASFNNCVVP